MANQVDFKILPSDQFSVYSPSTRSDKIITYFTLLSKLRGDILTVSSEEDPNNITSAYYTNSGGVQTLHLVKADGSEITASTPEQIISGTVNFVSKFTTANDIGDSQIFDNGTNVGIGTTTMTHKLQLGTGGVFADYFQLDTTYSNGFVVGALSWDIDNGTADIGLSGSLKLKIGQDDVWYVKNSTGSAINKGTAVYASGTLGASSKILITPMIADGSIPARFFLGIVAETIANGAEGYVLTKGKLRNINTNAYNEGDVLWVSPTVAGALTSTEPTAPDLKLPVAFVVNKGNNGVLAIRATTGQRIADASDVDYTGALDNSFLVYNATSGVWEDEVVGIFKTIAVATQGSIVADAYDDTLTIAAGTGISITTAASTDTLTITNSAPDQVVSLTGAGTTVITGTYPSFTITSNDEFDGTVTSVAALTLGTTGTDLSSTVVNSTTTPVITLNVPTASATNRGALSSADWTTFNSKEPALTKGNLTEATSSVLTITGGTNAVIGTGTTIQVAQAGASSSGYLSSADWTTFNSKEPALTKGNLTEATSSVLTITNGTGAVIGSGTSIEVSQASSTTSGYLSSADWTTFNSKQGALTFTAPLVNTSGTITINQSGSASDGYLSSTDWTTFNSKEPALTKGNLTEATSSVLTITGGTGAVIGSGATIQVIQASSTTSGYLSSTDWTTFNGKASNSFTTIAVATQSNIVADTATDTLTIAAGTGVSITTDALTDTLTISATGSGGTVTSISTTAPITGGPITGTGTIAITQSGTASDGYLSSADWNTFNGKQNAITLTTTGSSGAATLVGATLNIPQYTDQFTGTVTSVAALTLGTTGTDLSSTVANGTTTPVITLNVPTASATNRGALSSGDWTTFNGKTGLAFKTISVTGQTDIVADAAEDTLNVAAGTGISLTTTALSDTLTITNSDLGSSQNIFKNIAVSSQTTIVADSNDDTLTLAAGTGISITTNATTDTVTITNTAVTSIDCFAAYTSQNLSLAVSGTEYYVEFDNVSISDTSVFSHSTTTNPENITVLAAGRYEVSFGFVALNGNNQIATVQGYISINNVAVPSFSFLQLNTTTVGQYVGTALSTYIYDLDANDVINATAFPTYVGGSTGTITVNPSGYDGSTYITIKKIG
jgi:hypothetical protein